MINIPDIQMDLKFAVIGGTLLFAAMFFFVAGYHFGAQPEEVVCKEHIKSVGVLSEQVKELELKVATDRDYYTTECIKREKDICSDMVDKATENLKRLRCKICNASGGVR